jgi:hypothetical protein
MPTVTPNPDAPIRQCQGCLAPIWWHTNPSGKRQPFDVTEGVRTVVPHHATCPKAAQYKGPRQPRLA